MKRFIPIMLSNNPAFKSCAYPESFVRGGPNLITFLYPATKVWRGIMLYPSVSVRLSVRPSVRPSVRAHHFRSIT